METAWMKGVPTALVDTPIPPVSPFDDRPIVHDLIQEHREKIDKIANLLKDHPLYEPETKHDDLWILRFYLSHKKTKQAAEAAKKTLEYRQEYKRDATDIRFFNVRMLDPKTNPSAKFLEYCDRSNGGFFLYTCLEETRGITSMVNLGCIDSIRMAKEQPKEFWFDSFSNASEFCFQWADYLTRTTGRLTKSIRVVDLTNYHVGKNFCMENNRRTAAAARQLTSFYPQLIDACYVINVSTVLQVSWNMLRSLLPASCVRRIDFIDPVKNVKDRQKLYRHIAHEHLPSLLGGANGTPVADLDLYKQQHAIESGGRSRDDV